jgi:hypothetical protein
LEIYNCSSKKTLIDRCKEILETEGYIHRDVIRKYPEVNNHIKHNWQFTELCNDLIKNIPELVKKKVGRNIIICRKGNEPAMIKKATCIQTKKAIKTGQGSLSKALQLAEYLKENHLGEQLHIPYISKICRSRLGVSKDRIVKELVYELKQMGVLKASAGGYAPYKVLRGT